MKAKTETDNNTIKLSDLTLDPANTRIHPERNRSTMEASLRRFGAARSIVVDADGVVRAGNGTLEAAKAAGIEDALVVDADGDRLVVVRRMDWTPSEATAYSIADNRASDQSENDDQALALMLTSLKAEGLALSDVGYTDEEFAKLLGIDDVASTDDATPPDDFTSHDEDIDTEYCCPKCSYSWSGKPK